MPVSRLQPLVPEVVMHHRPMNRPKIRMQETGQPISRAPIGRRADSTPTLSPSESIGSLELMLIAAMLLCIAILLLADFTH
jgi:hypothetical protein